jgi:hypothetical protein
MRAGAMRAEVIAIRSGRSRRRGPGLGACAGRRPGGLGRTAEAKAAPLAALMRPSGVRTAGLLAAGVLATGVLATGVLAARVLAARVGLAAVSPAAVEGCPFRPALPESPPARRRPGGLPAGPLGPWSRDTM